MVNHDLILKFPENSRDTVFEATTYFAFPLPSESVVTFQIDLNKVLYPNLMPELSNCEKTR